jgi:hypothetical protein
MDPANISLLPAGTALSFVKKEQQQPLQKGFSSWFFWAPW